MKHLSIRVPWHDLGWDGRICEHPCLNSSCLRLKRIGETRDDTNEEQCAGKPLSDLEEKDWPACIAERGAFMAPFEYVRTVAHPYAQISSKTHGHLLPTSLVHPPFTAAAVPFNWLLRENADQLSLEYALHLAPEPAMEFKTSWIQSHVNQNALENCFFEQIQPGSSLVFFYAKQVPFVEDAHGRRIIIGVGRILRVGEGKEYDRKAGCDAGAMHSMLWERMVHHSIRPDFTDGFLLPYHAALAKAEEDASFDPSSVAVFSPEDKFTEFSFAAEHVSSDSAIEILLSCASSLRKVIAAGISGPWESCLEWIDSRLNELWTARGPYPGFGSALSALGLPQGTLFAQWITDNRAGSDLWTTADEILSDPDNAGLPAHYRKLLSGIFLRVWKNMKSRRKEFLKMLSRFALSKEQTSVFWDEARRKKEKIEFSDEEVLKNPYLFYERSRLSRTSIGVQTVDRGICPPPLLREAGAIPEACCHKELDIERIRALLVSLLEAEAEKGNTLQSQAECVRQIREMNLQPPCPVNMDIIEACREDLEDEIKFVCFKDDTPALQLRRLSDMEDFIRRTVKKRLNGRPLELEADWRSLLDEVFGPFAGKNDELARKEKAKALEMLASSRFSLLLGPAGAGKTSLLSVLCHHPEVSRGGVLLLAPTGKARIRMENAVGLPGKTLAQFLLPSGRYDADTGRYYCFPGSPSCSSAQTVIIDEASMLTEEMLAATLQAISAQRIILVGDPRQLPPIGAGKPFADILHFLQEKKEPAGLAELTVRMRQEDEERHDVQLTGWYSGDDLRFRDKELFDDILEAGNDAHLRFERWDDADQLKKLLSRILCEELSLQDENDAANFAGSLGATIKNGIGYFNFGNSGNLEDWQILSPLRSSEFGSTVINREIHQKFRRKVINSSRRRSSALPRPAGCEEIVTGDKVINTLNARRSSWSRIHPEADYVANGEIGITLGKRNMLRGNMVQSVEFSSQPNVLYFYESQEFGEEGNPVLELAYALTVHKAQGSEFGLVILILPDPCRLLSRELLYTALTRQKRKMVILHQGPVSSLRQYHSAEWSETARRLTCLFDPADPVQAENGHFYERGLIHITARGEFVRSKSEVIIANQLAYRGIPYAYEKKLTLENETRWPDFTIEDKDSGNVFYWEHCGMMDDPEYRERWEAKLKWYAEHGILPYEDGGGRQGTLIVTEETKDSGIDTQYVDRLILNILS